MTMGNVYVFFFFLRVKKKDSVSFLRTKEGKISIILSEANHNINVIFCIGTIATALRKSRSYSCRDEEMKQIN